MTTHRLDPQIFYYTFGPHEPALRISPGDTVSAETRDAWGLDKYRQPIEPPQQQPAPGTTLKYSNPLVGPIFVEGAAQGDLLAVHIDAIELNRDVALSKQSANFGSLTGEYAGHNLLYNPPIETVQYEWQLDLERNVGMFEMPNSRVGRIEAPLAPFIGSIGVAPSLGRHEPTLAPGEFGGNMDCVETKVGTTLYLPVWVDGGYLFFGDVHALQGDGEVNGTALEMTADVTLTIDVVKKAEVNNGAGAEWPRLEDETHLMVAGSTRPLMDCVRLAQVELLRWLVEEYGFEREEVWQLMGQVGTMRIGNVVDPQYTVVAKFPKRYLP